MAHKQTKNMQKCQKQSCSGFKLTSKKGDSTSKEASEANIYASVNQARREAIGNPVLYHCALNHIQDRHGVHLHTMATPISLSYTALLQLGA